MAPSSEVGCSTALECSAADRPSKKICRWDRGGDADTHGLPTLAAATMGLWHLLTSDWLSEENDIELVGDWHAGTAKVTLQPGTVGPVAKAVSRTMAGIGALQREQVERVAVGAAVLIAHGTARLNVSPTYSMHGDCCQGSVEIVWGHILASFHGSVGRACCTCCRACLSTGLDMWVVLSLWCTHQALCKVLQQPRSFLAPASDPPLCHDPGRAW